MLKSTKLKNTLLVGATAILVSCGGQKEIKMGSYAYDAQFLKDHGIEYTELVSADGNSKVMVIPAWQGRVMTTSASGDEGDSYGWINYRFINEGKVSSQFNPVGGEERFWLGPEGGPFSLYFKEGQEQVYDNWIVPPVLDTEAFDIKSQDNSSIRFVKDTRLTNASGTTFDMNIDRTVSLMDAGEVAADFNIQLTNDMKIVAYKSENKITNTGDKAWTKEGGLVSVWMLGCFNPTPTTTVFIPYKWKIQCKLPPKTKRFCPLKTFNNAPLKSLDRWGYYYFSLFPSVCSHFTDTFSCQLNPVRRMYNTIHNGICYCRVSDCIIPIVRWQLRGDDDGLAPMSVLYYIEQDGSFLGIKVHKEEVIQYEQRAPFDSLEFRFQCAFYFCHLKRTHKFRSIRIICPYALLAGFIPHCCGKEALPGTG